MTIIHVAHAIGRKGGTHYRARAFAERDGIRHSFTISIDDTAEDAESNAIRYVREMHVRDGMNPPREVVSHGRVAGAILDNLLF